MRPTLVPGSPPQYPHLWGQGVVNELVCPGFDGGSDCWGLVPERGRLRWDDQAIQASFDVVVLAIVGAIAYIAAGGH